MSGGRRRVERAGERKTLDRAISRAGLCSRAEAARAVAEGRVSVNGRRASDPQAWVDPERERILVDGEPLGRRARVVLLLNKPKGCVTTRSDPQGRRTVYDLIGPRGGWVAPVGRLDRDTSGLLLLTNDSALAARITDPASKLAKTYRVEARGELGDDALAALRRGVELEDGLTRPAEVRLVRRGRTRTIIELSIREGRNRQVRRMLAAVGSKVLELRRTSVGPLALGELASGAAREIEPGELVALNAALGYRGAKR